MTTVERSWAIFQLRTCSCFFLSGLKRLLWSKVERSFSHKHAAVFSLWIEEAALEWSWAIFQPRTCSCFFSQARSCFGVKLSDLSATNMQLFFLSGSKRLLWSKVERSFSHKHAAVFLSGSKRLLWRKVENIFSHKHAADCSVWIEEAALERSWAIFLRRTCVVFFTGSKRLL